MEISKKLSVLVGTAGVWFLQQYGIDAGEVVNQVIVTPLGDMTEKVAKSSDDTIYYVSAIYIAVQGLIDTVKTWVIKDENDPPNVEQSQIQDSRRV